MFTRANPSTTPAECRTLVELLGERARLQPARQGYVFLPDGNEEPVALTYLELDRSARAIAAALRDMAREGDRALLLYEPGLNFVAGFFGCLYAGVIAVPAYPPDPLRLSRSLPRLRAVLADSQATVALTSSSILSLGLRLFEHAPDLQALRWLATDAVKPGAESVYKDITGSSKDVAFLQYTSGSTGMPKGVMLTHANLLHNAKLVHAAVEHTPEDKYVSWLPAFHDMGFMAGVLQPLFAGIEAVLMSPLSFLQDPARWLAAISRYRATTSGAPNFAYDLCARKVSEAAKSALDLSSWTVAFNGSEPVRYETMRRFADAFEPCGFRREAFYPCYGLAEATLMVTGGSKSAAPTVCKLDAAALEKNRISAAAPDGRNQQTLVGCGRTLAGQKIAIVNSDSLAECSPGEVGEIWVSGESVALGYWNRAEETERVFNAHIANDARGPFLRTGDLGFLEGGELFVTGRLKDLIIIRGLNHYPQDIELTVERSHTALRPGCGAAFSLEVQGEERLVIVQEVDQRNQPDLDLLIDLIREHVAYDHELQTYAVALIKSGSIPKTSSGKIQRHACRAAFLGSALEVVKEWRADSTSDAAAFACSPLPSPDSLEGLEGRLSRLIADRLRIDVKQVDVNQPIIRYGLDSFAAVELAHSIEESFGMSLPLADLLKGAEIAGLARRILESQIDPAAVRGPRIDSNIATDVYTLSYGQRGLWFLQQLAPESSAYNIARAIRVRSEIDAEALRRVFQKLVDRHASLRTTFDNLNGEPARRVRRYSKVDFSAEDVSGLSELTLSDRLIEEAHEPFKLEEGPLMRARLFNRSEDDHILVFVIHHIVVDFWSLAILLHELGILYMAEKHATAAALEPLAYEYADYVRYQQEMLMGEAGERLWRYWSRQLAGELPALSLPADKARPPVQTFRGASYPFRLDSDLAERLKSFSREHDATLFVTLLAAFAALLYRYTGQREVLVGTPTAGRPSARFAGVVGYFVNPIVMRVELSPDSTFEDSVEATKRIAIAAFEHQDYPFTLLTERLQPHRDPSRSPLFQAMLTLQRAPLLGDYDLSPLALGEAGGLMNLGSLQVESMPLEQRIALFDMHLMAAESAGGLSASLEYNTDVFDPATVQRLAAHFVNLARDAMAHPERAVSKLSLLDRAERNQLLIEWNAAQAATPREMCFHQIFEAQVEQTPEAIAASFNNERLTYRDLNDRANRVADFLIENRVGPDVIVGIFAERSVSFLCVILGVFKAGAAYLPLDPSYPRKRVRQMLMQSGCSLVLSDGRLAPELLTSLESFVSSERPAVKSIDELFLREDGCSNPAIRCSPGNLAYVIFTSGSTGVAKAVMVEHRGMLNHFYAKLFELQLSDADAIAQTASQCFDISVWQFLGALLAGGRTHIIDSETARDPARLVEEIGRGSVSILEAVPSLMKALLNQASNSEQESGGLSRLRWMIATGEALPLELCSEWFSLHRDIPLLNGYGPTECSDNVSHFVMRESPPASTINVPIGRPIINTRLYILDESFEPVPAGVPGQLYVGGIGVGRGYLNDPQRTAENFICDPFASEKGERIYKTGDLARHLQDGNIEFLGRIDHQVKIRGFRIELGEIESALIQHPLIKQAVVVARNDVPGDERLAAYVISSGATPLAGELRAYLKVSLPDYMIPSAFVTLDAFPLTASGKVNRRALPAPSFANEPDRKYVAPRSHLEELLAGIWAEVLNTERVGMNDNFFDSGGHSLLAAQVASRVGNVFGLRLPLRTIFEEPTIAGLARAIESSIKAVAGSPDSPLKRASRAGNLPMSFAQQRLWFLDRVDMGGCVYNMPGAIDLAGELNVDALRRSLNEIISRHEALRTTFNVIDGQPFQVIAQELSLDLPAIDLTRLEPSARDTEAARLSAEESRRYFNLAEGPLIRAKLLRLASDSHTLLLTLHHIVCDGWSLGVFVRELKALYEAFADGEPSPLRPLEIQYADFAFWQKEWLVGDVLEDQLSYWAKQLAGLTELQLPTDRPRPAIQTFSGAKRPVQIPRAVADGLKIIARKNGATLFMTLLAAYAGMLRRYTGQGDVSIGSPIAYRNRHEVEALIGFFANTLVMRIDAGGEVSFCELLARSRETALGAYAHQDLPFELLVDRLQPGRDLSRNPLFQVMLALQNAPMPALELPGLIMRAAEIDNGTTKFDLTLNLTDGPEGLTGWMEYNVDLFDTETIARMSENFQVFLEAAAHNPNSLISDLPLLSESERRLLLSEWNDTRVDYSRDRCLPEIFENQVEIDPEAVALDSDSESLTYAALDQRANQLAHYLISTGAGPDAHIGLCVERGIDMAVGVLGILKAGAAYVPLDPAYPKQRLASMIDDAQPPVILTQERVRHSLPDCRARLVFLDSDWSTFAARPAINPRGRVHSDNLAYLIYTSGSTGKPKGIGLSHRALVNLIEWHDMTMPRRSRILQFASLSFDASFHEMFSAWCSGATVCVISDSIRMSPVKLAQYLIENNIEKATLPVIVLQQLAEDQRSRGWSNSSIQEIIATGEQLQITKSIKEAFKSMPQASLINHYGPSETHVVTALTLGADVDLWPSHPSIGKPIHNTTIYILDERLRPVPIGVIGELYIGGVSLARGYLNRPELTAEKFIPDPFCPGRLYKSGDLARYLHNGDIEFLGRIDHQVKIRGFRIELGEVESALGAHNSVNECVVIAREDKAGEKRLVAYIVAADARRPELAAELRGFLKDRLPDYMIPASFVMLDELPLTQNGKVNRKALPAPDVTNSGAASAYVAPRSVVEESVAKIWEEVLGVERVGVEDNFFDLGGHSLLAAKLQARIADAFRVEIPLRTFFKAATVSDLSQALIASEPKPGQVEKIARVLKKINGMSDKQMLSLLKQKRNKATLG